MISKNDVNGFGKFHPYINIKKAYSIPILIDNLMQSNTETYGRKELKNTNNDKYGQSISFLTQSNLLEDSKIVPHMPKIPHCKVNKLSNNSDDYDEFYHLTKNNSMFQPIFIYQKTKKFKYNLNANGSGYETKTAFKETQS